MFDQYTLTGIIYGLPFNPKQLAAYFPNSKVSKKHGFVVQHAQYCLTLEDNVISAQASDYDALTQALEAYLQQQQVSFMFEVFEVDGRLVARFQG